MILSRIARALREQNWLAVGLEFIIVLAGIVIGFQVTAWNADRVARADEGRLLSQLRGDVAAQISNKQDWIDDQSGRNAALAAAVEIIQTPDGEENLTDSQCRAAWGSHIVIPTPSRLATFDEIMATRGLSSLRDPELRAALLAYGGEMVRLREVNAFIRDDLVKVVDEYGEAMPRRLNLSDGTSDATCRLDLIRSNPTLQNRLISNYGRANALVLFAGQELALLETVLAALDGEASNAEDETGRAAAALSQTESGEQP